MKTKLILLSAVAALALTGCYQDFDKPDALPVVTMTPTHTIAELKAMYAERGGAFDITEQIIIGGRVTSSDEAGNFYRSMYIEDATAGIEIRVGTTGLSNFYKLGQMVYVKANGLRLGGYRGMVILGGPIPENYQYETTYIGVPALIERTIFAGPWGERVEPKLITEGVIPEADWGRWVRFENAVFVESTYYDADGLVNGGNVEIDTWGNPDYAGESSVGKYGNAIFEVNGEEINVRTSGYAKFASQKVPEKGAVCNIEGILTYYSGGRPPYQITINSLQDIEVVSR